MTKNIDFEQTLGASTPFFGYIWGMTLPLLFTIAIFLILLRVFWLHVKSSNAQTESFKNLLPKDKMTVLKECLLNNPTEGNLQNLKEFCNQQNLDFDDNTYRPFLKKQLELANRRASVEDCDALYAEECDFLDQLTPLEFAEADEARQNGDSQTAITRTLEGISRLYSDKAIESALEKLVPEYAKAAELLAGYKELVEARDTSGADDASLEALRKKRDDWFEKLLSTDSHE